MLLKKFKIIGHSMHPKLRNGDTVFVSYIPYLFRKPKVNDVVAVFIDEKVFIKRIKEIIGGKYFLRGDNIKDSLDSRKFGSIFKERIIGKVVYKIK